MPDEGLTAVQRNVLAIMMIRATPLPFNTVSNSLNRDKRLDLVKRGYIESDEKARPITMELTQSGHDRAVEELAAGQPGGTQGLLQATTFDFLRRLLEHTGVDSQDLFRLRLDVVARAISDAPAPASTEVADRVRSAYRSVVARPGGNLMLADLRDALPDVSRSDLDAALVALNRDPGVHIVPESNQKALTTRERAAAVRIGNQDKHVISLDA